MQKEITIERNVKTRLMVFGSSLVGGYYTIKNLVQKLILEDYSNPWLLLLSAVLGTVFSYQAIKSLFALLEKGPAVLINSKGITDFISDSQAGLIGWDEIKSVDVQKYVGKKHLVIHLHNYEKIYEKHTDFKRKVLLQVEKKLGSPIAISTQFAKFDPVEIAENISKMLEILSIAKDNETEPNELLTKA